MCVAAGSIKNTDISVPRAKSEAKATTCKEAIQRWEEANGKSAADEKQITLCFQWLPIEKMDNSLSLLTKVELMMVLKSFTYTSADLKKSVFLLFRKLSLSTNMIEKISGINSLQNLKILSLGRNYIKTFAGLEAVGDHLEELWISYNLIEKLKGVNVLKALKVLYMSNNLVKDWIEFNRLTEVPNLEELLFVNNPICENLDVENWRNQVSKKLPNLKKLDSIPIVRIAEEAEEEHRKSSERPSKT